ncbi:MAG: CHAT domain-containing tetratricopeptide repeat protein [Phormidesmis sp.]
MRWPWQRQEKQATSEPTLQPLSDRKYEQLYFSLLALQETAGENAAAQLQDRLGEKQHDPSFVGWLRRFGQGLLSSSADNTVLAQQMVALADSDLGELSALSGTFSEQLLTQGNTMPQPPQSVAAHPQQNDDVEANASEPSAEQQAEFYFQQGNEAFYRGDFRGAIAAYDAALSIKPDLYKVVSNKGAVLTSLGQFEDALMAFDAALNIKTNYREAFNNKGVALNDLGRFEDAITAFDTALNIKPDDHEAFYNKGVSLANLNRFEDAIAALDAALNIKTDDHEAWIKRGSVANSSHKCRTSVISSLPTALQDLSLDQRGYDGQIASYTVGLKHVSKDQNPEGWGLLHYELGRAHYFYARFLPKADLYVAQATSAYQTALITLKAFPPRHLAVLQDAIRAYLGLGNLLMVKDCRKEGLAIFQQLLNDASSPAQKRQLEQKFSGFSQLQVDSLVRDTNPITALQTAEYYKNRTLGWILDTWKEQTISPDWQDIQTLLAPKTTALYWHLSPDSLTTFILSADATEPKVLSVQSATELETWLKKWNQHYQAYRSKGKVAETNKELDAWRINLQTSLTELKTILGIPAIADDIQNVSQLLLIPHRDLHRLPLHTFFPDHLTAYLPSLQIGLTLKRQVRTAHLRTDLALLNLADPRGEATNRLESAEIEATLISQLFDHADTIPAHQATTQTLTEKLQAPNHIFNFSGHAWAERQPQYSALHLKGEDRLTAGAICKLSLENYELITLSACETAVTGLQTIESDYVGLVSAFLTAGAQNIISTLWTVESESNAWLMVRFYQHYVKGDDPATALKKAQTWLRTLTYADLLQWLIEQRRQLSESDNPGAHDALTDRIGDIQSNPSKIHSDHPPYADPYYWAAFTVTGYLPSYS